MNAKQLLGLFTEVRGIGILRTSPFGDSAKFACMEFLDLEDFPTEVGVEAIVEDVGVAYQGVIIRQRKLHAAYDCVQTLGFGPPVLLVHQVGVVDSLRDLAKHRIVEAVLLQEGLEGAIVPTVGEPGPHHIEELRLLRGLRRIAEEDEACLLVQEAPNQPYAGGAVHVAAPARGPQHQTLPSAPGTPDDPSRSLTASRAALSAPAASRRSGERK